MTSHDVGPVAPEVATTTASASPPASSTPAGPVASPLQAALFHRKVMRRLASRRQAAAEATGGYGVGSGSAPGTPGTSAVPASDHGQPASGGGGAPVGGAAPGHATPGTGAPAFTASEFHVRPLAPAFDSDGQRVNSPGVALDAFIRAPQGRPPAGYRAGALQTMIRSTRQAFYRNAEGREIAVFTATRGASMDQNTELHPPAPFYAPPVDFTDVAVPITVQDQPWTRPPWVTLDYTGHLARLHGGEEFCTWIVAIRGGEPPIYLEWTTWEISWNGAFEHGDFRGGRQNVTGQGTGRGAVTPVLSGTPPNLGLVGTWAAIGGPAAAHPGGGATSPAGGQPVTPSNDGAPPAANHPPGH